MQILFFSNIQSMFYCKLAARVVWNRWDCNNKADVEAINCFFWRRLVVPGLKKSNPNGCFTLNLAQRKQHICNLSTSRHYMYMYVVCIYIYTCVYTSLLQIYKHVMYDMHISTTHVFFSNLITLDVYCWISIMCRPALKNQRMTPGQWGGGSQTASACGGRSLFGGGQGGQGAGAETGMKSEIGWRNFRFGKAQHQDIVFGTCFMWHLNEVKWKGILFINSRPARSEVCWRGILEYSWNCDMWNHISASVQAVTQVSQGVISWKIFVGSISRSMLN